MNKETKIIKEMKKWLNTCLDEAKENDVYDRTNYELGIIATLESCIAKMKELESRDK